MSCLFDAQRYIGGLLCTPDGQLPSSDKLDEIWKVLRSAEIEPWGKKICFYINIRYVILSLLTLQIVYSYRI